MIFGKLKLYLIAALGFIAALGMAVLKGQSMQETKRMKERLEGIKHKEEVEDEVDNRNDDDLVAGIVRKRR